MADVMMVDASGAPSNPLNMNNSVISVTMAAAAAAAAAQQAGGGTTSPPLGTTSPASAAAAAAAMQMMMQPASCSSSASSSSSSSAAAAAAAAAVNTQSVADYLAQLLKDKKQLTALPNVFHHVERLLDEGTRFYSMKRLAVHQMLMFSV